MKSSLPAASDLAQQVRDGNHPDDIGARYHVTAQTVRSHLAHAGWSSSTGFPFGARAGWDAPVPRPRADPQVYTANTMTYVAGDDRGPLPTGTVVYSGEHNATSPHYRKRAHGLDWDRLRPTPIGV